MQLDEFDAVLLESKPQEEESDSELEEEDSINDNSSRPISRSITPGPGGQRSGA